jgi:malonate transporter and related proteins
MSLVWQFFRLSAPLYGLVAAGYVIACLPWWRTEWSRRVSRLVFAIALPALLFHLMSHQARSAAVDVRVLAAYFGSCLIVYFVGRTIGAWLFNLDGPSQAVFGLGGIFSNVVLTGLPIAKLTLGPAAVPTVALILVFNALTLWTLVSVSVEWSLHGSFSAPGLVKTLANVLRNPIVLSIVLGVAFSQLGLALPTVLDAGLGALGNAAAPAALVSLGMELAGFPIRQQWSPSVTVCGLKLLLQPLVVWLLAIAIGLPSIETRAVVLVASMAIGINVYLMAVQFKALQGTIAGSIVLSNLFAAFTTPLILAALHASR